MYTTCIIIPMLLIDHPNHVEEVMRHPCPVRGPKWTSKGSNLTTFGPLSEDLIYQESSASGHTRPPKHVRVLTPYLYIEIYQESCLRGGRIYGIELDPFLVPGTLLGTYLEACLGVRRGSS